MVLIDAMRGERERLVFLKQEEDAYLRRRDPDTELPLSKLQLEGPAIWYHKGALVMYMLERQIGRDRLLRGLQQFVARWRDLDEPRTPLPRARDAVSHGHPTLRDLLDELRAAHSGDPLDWFYATWFDAVVVPDMALDSSPSCRNRMARGRSSSPRPTSAKGACRCRSKRCAESGGPIGPGRSIRAASSTASPCSCGSSPATRRAAS
jgi:hypothetical protein